MAGKTGAHIFFSDFDEASPLDSDADQDAAAAPASAVEPPPPPPPPPLTEADLAAARAEGHRAGLAEAADSETRAQSEALARIADRLDASMKDAAECADKTATALAELMYGAFVAACPALRGRYGEPEVMELVRAILPGLAREPVVHVKVNAELIDKLRPMFRPYRGKLEFDSCADMSLGEIEVEWKDGGARLRSDDVCRQISEVLYGELEQSQNNPAPTEPQD